MAKTDGYVARVDGGDGDVAPTGYELQATLRRWKEWVQGDLVTENDGRAVEALEWLANEYLPQEGVANMAEPVWVDYARSVRDGGGSR